MVGSMRSSDSSSAGGYSGNGGQDSPSESRGGPGSGAGSSSSKSSGGLNSAGNRASGAGPGASSNRTTSSNNGGLNSAGNRASGAGPGASSNRSTTGGGFGGTGNANGGGSGSSYSGRGGQDSPSETSGVGRGSSLGGGMAPTAHDMQAASDRRAAENASMSTYNAARSLSQDNASRADLAQQARTAETQSMGDMATWGKEVKSVVDAGQGWTTVSLNNGQTETRKGDRASRNNNPGNIKDGAWTKSQPGYVGTDGTFGVFASKEDGINAIGSLLGTSKYTSKTVGEAIGSYAPPSENNTAAYASTVASKVGVSQDTPMSSLTAAQRTAMAHAIMGVEGNTGYAATTTGTDRFSSTYMGGKTAASTPDKSAATAQEAAKAQNDPSGLPPGTYRGHVVGDGIAPTFAAPTKQATAAPTPTPERPRSITEKVAAGAIDVGLGMLPGVGMGVSLVNGGLALTGNKTLGENIVGSFVEGKGGPGPDSGADRTGGGSGGGQVVKNTSTVPKDQESFESRYLAFVDPTPRPTPTQRWDYSTSGYS